MNVLHVRSFTVHCYIHGERQRPFLVINEFSVDVSPRKCTKLPLPIFISSKCQIYFTIFGQRSNSSFSSWIRTLETLINNLFWIAFSQHFTASEMFAPKRISLCYGSMYRNSSTVCRSLVDTTFKGKYFSKLIFYFKTHRSSLTTYNKVYKIYYNKSTIGLIFLLSLFIFVNI